MKRIAVPLFGKMIFRSFHNRSFIGAFRENGLEPVYYLTEQTGAGRLDKTEYLGYPDVQTGSVERFLVDYRRMLGHRDVSDMKFQDRLYTTLIHKKSFLRWHFSNLAMDVLRRQRWLAPATVWLSRIVADTDACLASLETDPVDAVLTSGVGSAGFNAVNPFVYAAQEKAIPVVAAVSNYDNILSRGYRGFMPTAFAVWSKVMAEDAMRLLDIPARRIEITGPAQFDRYFSAPAVDRETFLRSRNLNPANKTLLYGGGANLLNALHILRLFIQRFRTEYHDCNIVMRLHPDPRLKDLPVGWCMQQVAREHDNVYISDPLNLSADTIDAKEDIDELHCLLKYSDAIIQHYSTLGLEAAICDLPTLYMKYDPCDYFHYWSTTSTWGARQVHNRRSLRLAAGKEALDDQSMMSVVAEYFANRSRNADARREYARSECEYLDGRSGERLAELVRSRIS